MKRGGTCATEKIGMDCRNRKGCALENLPLLTDWWRATAETESAYACELEGACLDNSEVGLFFCSRRCEISILKERS